MWVTWGHKVGHVPEAVHKSEGNAKTLMKWIEKGVSPSNTAVEAQRFCLAVGLVLSDLQFVDVDTDGVDSWPEDLPGYLAYSHLGDGYRDMLTDACAKATLQWAPPGDPTDSSVNADGEESTARPPSAEPHASQPASSEHGTSDNQAPPAASAPSRTQLPSPDEELQAHARRGRGRGPAAAVGKVRKATRAAEAAAVGRCRNHLAHPDG